MDEVAQSTATAAKAMQPWMYAAAAGLGLGVLVGMRLSKMFGAPSLPPVRQCADCERRIAEHARATQEAAAKAREEGARVTAEAPAVFSPHSTSPQVDE